MDTIAFVEACYRRDLDQEDWLTGLAQSAAPFFDRGYGVAAFHVRDHPDRGEVLAIGGRHAFGLEFIVQMGERMPPEFFRQIERQAGGIQIGREVLSFTETSGGEVEGASEALWRRVGAPGPIRDHLALVTLFRDREAIVVGAHSPERVETSARDRARWAKLAWHLGAGWRLSTTSGVEAVLDPGGDVVHAEGAARDATETLREHAKRIDRARTRRGRDDPDSAIDLWTGLVDGRWSLVDRFDSDGRRYVVAHANPFEFHDPRAFTARERDCAQLAARGCNNAQIAYALGIRSSTVASHVARALHKLGLAHRAELTTLLGTAADAVTEGPLAVGSAPTAFEHSALSEAERAVAALARAGETNDAIAAHRGTSARTVANQLASIYRKLKVSSRAELAALRTPPS